MMDLSSSNQQISICALPGYEELSTAAALRPASSDAPMSCNQPRSMYTTNHVSPAGST